MEKLLFEKMLKAIELKNEKELEYLIAKREYEKVKTAYLAYKKEGNNNA